MMNRKTMASATLVGLAGVTLLMTGCKGEPPPPPVVQAAPAPPPPPPPPRVATIEELMTQLGIDKRIVLAEDKAPATTEDRKAVLVFFDAFVRGDNEAVSSMIGALDRIELQELVESGQWKHATEGITRVEIQTGASPLGSTAALAVYEIRGGFQPQMWYMSSDATGHSFEAVPSPPGIINLLSGTDWIAAWHQINAAEMLLASALDEIQTVTQTNFDTNDGSSSSDGTEPARGPAMTPPPPDRRPPPAAPRKPPGPG